MCLGVEHMNDKHIDFIETLTDPDKIAQEAFKIYKDVKYIDANLMVTWIVNRANKLLEESK